MKRIVLAIIIIGLIASGIYYLEEKSLQKAPVDKQTTGGVINAVTFACANGKTIHALFFDGKVELTLSDKRNMLLMQAVSASGARYANPDESFVFWNKGDTAFVEEKGATAFKECVVNKEQ